MTTSTDIPHVPLPTEHGTEILRCQVGSGLHGVTIDGTDDRDEMGICVEPPAYLIGLGWRDAPGGQFGQWQYRTQPEGARSGSGDLDLTVYGLRKWARLAAAGNPTVLLPLFAPWDQLVLTCKFGVLIQRNAHLFAARSAADRFIGYLRNQQAQMLGLRPGKRHTNWPELIGQFGFDTKSAYHMVRVGLQGVELLTTGRITLPIPEPDRSWLLDLRLGKHSREDALNAAERLILQLEGLRDLRSPLPAEPDRDGIDRLLIGIYREAWSA